MSNKNCEEILAKIKKLQKQITKLEQALPSVKEESRDEDGYLTTMPVMKADLSADFDAVKNSMKLNLKLKPEFDDCIMDWKTFVSGVKCGALSDYDGYGDFMLDGDVVENAVLYLTMECLYIYDRYMIPFDRIPDIFSDHDIKVVWFNK